MCGDCTEHADHEMQEIVEAAEELRPTVATLQNLCADGARSCEVGVGVVTSAMEALKAHTAAVHAEMAEIGGELRALWLKTIDEYVLKWTRAASASRDARLEVLERQLHALRVSVDQLRAGAGMCGWALESGDAMGMLSAHSAGVRMVGAASVSGVPLATSGLRLVRGAVDLSSPLAAMRELVEFDVVSDCVCCVLLFVCANSSRIV